MINTNTIIECIKKLQEINSLSINIILQMAENNFYQSRHNQHRQLINTLEAFFSLISDDQNTLEDILEALESAQIEVLDPTEE